MATTEDKIEQVRDIFLDIESAVGIPQGEFSDLWRTVRRDIQKLHGTKYRRDDFDKFMLVFGCVYGAIYDGLNKAKAVVKGTSHLTPRSSVDI